MERVVVTGVGVISSLGFDKDRFWSNLTRGESGITRITLFDTSKQKRYYGGQIHNFDSFDFITSGKIKFFGRASQFAIIAVESALRDSLLSAADIRKKETAVIIGTTLPEGSAIDLSSRMILEDKMDTLTKKTLLNVFAPSTSRNVGFYFNAKGANLLIPNACAAGNYAVGYGMDLLRKGEVDLAIVGGAEALSRIAFQGFQRLYAMAPEVCRPFDKSRDGMLLGEGAGILILEPLDKAKERGVPVYAEVLGYGLSCDAHHITIPKKEGVKKAMAKAVANSGIGEDDIDYISAHGTGTIQNDKTEAAAIKELLPRRYKDIPVSSIKSMLGHCMGAASGIESVACCLALKEGIIPPTINFRTPDPDCDIDCVPNEARDKKLNVVLNNGFAFGGNNCCVVFKGVKNESRRNKAL
jgi:3-oxoacyl-[acyl-carrier-protein] synthase II